MIRSAVRRRLIVGITWGSNDDIGGRLGYFLAHRLRYRQRIYTGWKNYHLQQLRSGQN